MEKRIETIICAGLGIVLCLGTATALAAGGKHRHHHHDQKAHVHGSGSLNLVAEKDKLLIELEIPANDIVGFEHSAKNKSQRTALEAAAKTLSDSQNVVIPNKESACKPAGAHVESEILPEATGVPTKHPKKHAGHAQSHKHHAKSDEDHSEFDLKYEFVCASPEKLKSVKLTLFDAFKGVKTINAQSVTPSGQKSQALSRTQSEFSF